MTGAGSSEEHSRLVKDCCVELALLGYAAWPNQTGAAWRNQRLIRFGKRGSGDIIVLLPTWVDGRLFAIHGEIECKTGEAVQSKAQKTHMRIVRNTGGVYLVIRRKEQVAEQLAALGFESRTPVASASAGPALLL